PGRETALRDALRDADAAYDYVLVDCPPSLGLLTLNVLAAAQGVIIPIQCEYYALEGISQLLNTVRLVQQNFNPALAIDGVLLTMYDSRLNLCRQVAEDAKEYFGTQVFRTPIPRNVRLAEAPSFGQPILLYDVQSVGARSYLAVGQELIRRIEQPESLSIAEAVTQEMPAAAVAEAAEAAPADGEVTATDADSFTPDDAPLDDLMADETIEGTDPEREYDDAVTSHDDDTDLGDTANSPSIVATDTSDDPVAADTTLTETFADDVIEDDASQADSRMQSEPVDDASADPEQPMRARTDATGDEPADEPAAGDITENAESAEVKP
ncbi:MAG TPA: AAA family ATPase, partial [Gemmatimonadales bacterium]|nr:AAA family ATPase [Gemmatimonadales bacterium]